LERKNPTFPITLLRWINAGCRKIFLTTGHGDRYIDELESLLIKPTLICDNFLVAAKEILRTQEI